MDKIFQTLKILSFIYFIFFLPDISKSQSIKITNSSFLGKTYEISDNCLITNEKLVNIIANGLGRKASMLHNFECSRK